MVELLKERFILKQLSEIQDQIINKNYLERYDLRIPWQELIAFRQTFQNHHEREPRVYEIIDIILKKIKLPLANHVREVLNKKNSDWFFNIGQYFFYNLYNWTRNMPSLHDQEKFCEEWLAYFYQYEQNSINPQVNQEWPEKILLELTNNCNLNCIMCKFQ